MELLISLTESNPGLATSWQVSPAAKSQNGWGFFVKATWGKIKIDVCKTPMPSFPKYLKNRIDILTWIFYLLT